MSLHIHVDSDLLCELFVVPQVCWFGDVQQLILILLLVIQSLSIKVEVYFQLQQLFSPCCPVDSFHIHCHVHSLCPV